MEPDPRCKRTPGGVVAAALLAVVGCGVGTAMPPASGSGGSGGSGGSMVDAASPDGADDANDRPAPVVLLAPRTPASVFVHLFEWRWPDIARECETYLGGTSGFRAVQVSPPSEHLVLLGAPWWQRYQTVGYGLEKSRSGTLAEFEDMVRRCAAVGVAIYVDAVINHMTGQPSGVGSNGTHFTKFSYPGLYTAADFHMPACTIADTDYQNAPDRVRNCELLGLADLNTGAEHVRATIAGYLASLVKMGVHGFRIDAAKHMDPMDLDDILRRVTTLAGHQPYYFFEVIDNGGEAIKATDYLATGQGAVEELNVTEFKYGNLIGDAFRGAGGHKLADLAAINAGTDLLPADRAVVFVANHDTERASALYYKDGAIFDLATLFMLASPYGYPSLLSSYAFDRTTDAGRAIGPPSDGASNTKPVWSYWKNDPDCVADPLTATEGWLCQHRRYFVRRMLSFRTTTDGLPVANAWDNGGNQIAFGRGDKGFVVINNDTVPLTHVFATGMKPGDYCNVYLGAPTFTGCSDELITVDPTGAVSANIAAKSALVIHAGALARSGR